MRKLKFWALSLAVVMCFFCLTACGSGQSVSDKWNDLWNNDTETPYTPLPHDPTVIWSESFAADSWAQIASISESGKAKKYYSVGDEKEIKLSTGEIITVVILGFDHDELADGSGKAGISFGMKDCFKTPYVSNVVHMGESWEACSFRNTELPSIFLQLPESLRLIIKPVYKYSQNRGEAGITIDKLFLFSSREVTGRVHSLEPGKQYEYWFVRPDGDGWIKHYIGRLGNPACNWFLRTFANINDCGAHLISYSGVLSIIDEGGLDSEGGLSFGFCA